MRWARILRDLGARVTVSTEDSGEPADLLIAMHARRCGGAVARFAAAYPNRPIVVALTGTDLYRDLPRSRKARRALELASRIVVLQPSARDRLAPHLRAKTRVVYQSVGRVGRRRRRSTRSFDVCFLGHLRAVKDPFRAALAARLLAPESRIRIVAAGRVLEAGMERRARAEERRNPRYRWLGELSHGRALALLERSRLLVLSSRLEGGANVLSEALALGVPVLASDVEGSSGILGADYPGLFPVGHTRGLTALLSRAESDPAFYRELERRCRRLAPLVAPARERQSWKKLLAEMGYPRKHGSSGYHSLAKYAVRR
jgi:putative glycosyltransferase (TIGR04348 family)